jgi:hypothetical protein
LLHVLQAIMQSENSTICKVVSLQYVK